MDALKTSPLQKAEALARLIKEEKRNATMPRILPQPSLDKASVTPTELEKSSAAIQRFVACGFEEEKGQK
jgi:hypothetical protein